MGEQTRLLQTGESAVAVVLELREADPEAGEDRQIELVLDVLPSHRPPFRATVYAIVSRLEAALVQPGMQVLVKFDPGNPGNIALAGFAFTTTGRTGTDGISPLDNASPTV